MGKYIIFPLHSTSRHFTSSQLPTLSASLHATSFHIPFCLPHFTPLCAPSLYFLVSLHFTSCHFTSPSILSASLHTTSLCLQFSSHHFNSLHATSLYLPFFLHHFTSLCAISLHLPFLFPGSLRATFSYSLHLISRHFTSPPVLSASLHTTS